MRLVPADRIADLHRRARTIRLVPGGIGPVPQHPILDVDQAREHQLGERLLAVGLVLHHTQKSAVGIDHLAAMHQREPGVQPLLQRHGVTQRVLVRPVYHGRGRCLDLTQVAPHARVMTRRLVDLLIPDIQPCRDVPDGLRHRQMRQLARQHARQVQRGARRQQAVVVVDEVRIPVVEPFVIRNMRIRRMDTDAGGDDLVQWPPGPQQAIVGLAGTNLVTRQDALLELVVERLGFVAPA